MPEVGGALVREPVGLQAAPVHHPKPGEAEVVGQPLAQPGVAEAEVVRLVQDLPGAAVGDLVQPHRRLEKTAEMEELHRERRAAVLPKRALRPEPDLLVGVVVDGLEDVGVPDHRLLVWSRREFSRLVAQPFEVERLRRPEADLCGLGSGPENTTVEQRGEDGRAPGEHGLAAAELHG